MSNLVPEVRADVNGKLVTRHVRTDVIPSAASRPIPAPMGASKDSANTIRHAENLKALQDTVTGMFISGDYSWQTAGTTLHDLNARTLNMSPSLAQSFRKQIDDQPDVGWEDMLISILNNDLNSEDAGYILFVTQSCLGDRELDNEWNEGVDGTESYDEAIKAYNGLKDFSKETGNPLPESIIDADEQTQKELTAVLHAMSITFNRGLYEYVSTDWLKNELSFNDYTLGELAMEYPDDVERIIDIMEERDMLAAEREVIVPMLESEAQSMSSGIL